MRSAWDGRNLDGEYAAAGRYRTEGPLGAGGNAFPIKGSFYAAPAFKDGGHVDTAKEFVRFLVADG